MVAAKTLANAVKPVAQKTPTTSSTNGAMPVYDVVLTLSEDLLGSAPKNREIYKDYIATKATPEQTEEEVVMIEDAEERGWTGFRADESGLLLLDYQIRGFFKEQADALRESGYLCVRNARDDGKPMGGVRGKIDRHLFVAPRRIYIRDAATGAPLTKPDGVVERPLRAQTAQGPRVSLARSDMVRAGRALQFRVATTWPEVFTEELIRQLLSRGEFMGLGQWRNASHGRFTFMLVRA